MTKMLVAIAFGLTASVVATGASAQVTLASVKQKGFLTCGASSGSIWIARICLFIIPVAPPSSHVA
jgi:hypothetical protein